jgi:hypothetical protein
MLVNPIKLVKPLYPSGWVPGDHARELCVHGDEGKLLHHATDLLELLLQVGGPHVPAVHMEFFTKKSIDKGNFVATKDNFTLTKRDVVSG